MEIKQNNVGSNNSRVCTLSFNSKKLLTPFYFPSITSSETRSDITDLIHFIVDKGYPAMLVSCYDLSDLKERKIDIHAKINHYYENGGILLLDSGEFEKYHFKREWSFEKYSEILEQTNADFFTSFDKTAEIDTSQDELDAFSDEFIPKSKQVSKDKNFIAIYHGNNDEESMCCSIKRTLEQNGDIQMIAISERECGRTISEQCNMIIKLRQTVNEYDKNILIHILGCGNPISIAAFSYAGADTFDAVDWCRWAIDPFTLEYANISHVKLFDCTCDACDATLTDERARTWLHNLQFYNYYLTRLRIAIEKKKSLSEFLEGENIDQKVISNLSKLF